MRRNSSRGTATSAIWKVAPILIHNGYIWCGDDFFGFVIREQLVAAIRCL
jgi:hypothetical protein